jgi:hypothetical protein
VPCRTRTATGAWSTTRRATLSENPSSTQPVDSSLTNNQRASEFAVNAHGDALILYTSQVNLARLQRNNGGFQNLSTQWTACATRGFGSNPTDFYFLDGVGNTSGPPLMAWTRLTKGTTFTRTEVGQFGINGNASCSAGLVRTPDAVYTAMGTTLYKLGESAVSSVPIPTLTSVKHISGISGAIYLLGNDGAGNGGILKFDTASSVFSTLLVPGEYALSGTMEVTGAGDITFHGQRASDGANVLGRIPAGSTTVEVISTKFAAVTMLVRLN